MSPAAQANDAGAAENSPFAALMDAATTETPVQDDANAGAANAATKVADTNTDAAAQAQPDAQTGVPAKDQANGQPDTKVMPAKPVQLVSEDTILLGQVLASAEAAAGTDSSDTPGDTANTPASDTPGDALNIATAAEPVSSDPALIVPSVTQPMSPTVVVAAAITPPPAANDGAAQIIKEGAPADAAALQPAAKPAENIAPPVAQSATAPQAAPPQTPAAPSAPMKTDLAATREAAPQTDKPVQTDASAIPANATPQDAPQTTTPVAAPQVVASPAPAPQVAAVQTATPQDTTQPVSDSVQAATQSSAPAPVQTTTPDAAPAPETAEAPKRALASPGETGKAEDAKPQSVNTDSAAVTGDMASADAAQPAPVAAIDTPAPKPAPQMAANTNMALHGVTAAQPQTGAPATVSGVTQHVQVTAEAPQPNVTALAVEISAKSQSGAKQFDIRLDPPELGRVEVRLSIDAAGKASAHLTAEQPQTLELLQKDATSLTRALRDAGLDVSQNSLNFSLRHQNHDGGANHGHARGPARGGMPLNAIQSTEATPASASWRGDGRLDIRV